MRNKIKINDIFAYIIGNYRYWCYENYKFLLRKHIIEQYEWRLSVMDKECYSSGSCIKCGCDTPALQMASKACEGKCYSPMLDKNIWNIVKKISIFETKIKPPILTVAESFPEKEDDEEYVWPIMAKENLPGNNPQKFEINLYEDWLNYNGGVDPFEQETNKEE